MKKQVLIQKFDYEGNGIAVIDEKVVFVNNAIPGEQVDIIIKNKEKNFDKAIVENYITLSEDRIENPCKYISCGGCDLLHLKYERELTFKEDKVKDIFLRKCNLTCVNRIIPSVDIFNYRNKVSFKTKNGKLAFNVKESSELIEINKCLLVNEKINEIINELNNYNLKDIEEVIIKNAKEAMLIIKSGKKINNNLKNINVNNLVVINNKNTFIIKGNKYIEENLGDIKYLIPANSFFQVNKQQTINLYNNIIEIGNFKKSDTVLDLYCGIGSISLYIENYVKEVIGVEINKEAIEYANKNKKLNNITNVKFLCKNANQVSMDFKPDIVIVDPPRNGLDKKTIEIIKAFNVKKIIYISCNPLTLARDINLFKDQYEVKEITPLDMFPRTHHIECISLFNLKEIIKQKSDN